MTDIEQMVTEFHRVTGMTIGTSPSVEVPEKELRFQLIQEEFEELSAEWGSYWDHRGEDWYRPADTAKWAKEAADLVYVIVGAFVTFGIPFNEVFEEVHASNLRKIWDDGTIHTRPDGKVIKPPTWTPPDIAGVLGQ